MYVAFTAAHWPMHALDHDIKKYEGKYDDGYDAVRAARYQRMIELGLIDPESTTNFPIPERSKETGVLGMGQPQHGSLCGHDRFNGPGHWADC